MNGKKILVTGGLGFIGSHTVVELIGAGYDVVIADDLSNSQILILERITKITRITPPFYAIDVSCKPALLEIFSKEKNIEAVIHFAASKSVAESVEKPLMYFKNNLCSLINVLNCMSESHVRNIVFSSSATVYGEPDSLPVLESAPFKQALSAYGSTKQMCEEILEKVAMTGEINAIALRYFNPVGAHPSLLIGELPIGIPNNLMPFVTQTAAGIREKLVVFGNDYPTPDGTCVRDYIHVVDLAQAHVRSCDRFLNNQQKNNHEVFNVGTGNGISVLEIIKAFEKYNDLKLNYAFGHRREGDAAAIYADASLIKKEIGWESKLGLKEMVTTAWQWQKKLSMHVLN